MNGEEQYKEIISLQEDYKEAKKQLQKDEKEFNEWKREVINTYYSQTII